MPVHPGTVLADVYHLKKVRINSCLLATGTKDGLMCAGCTGGHYNSVQALLFDDLLDLRRALLRTGKHIGLHHRHIRQSICISTQIFDVQYARDIDSAMAYKNTYPEFSLHFTSPLALD
jgi:hypothetical protein